MGLLKQPHAKTEGAAFVLHPQLAADGLIVGDLPLCRVLLMNNRHFPWLVLVPRQPHLREMIDLNIVDLHRLTDEIASASHVMKSIVSPDKLNIAALGNKVEQLHIHVIGRLQGDAAWPDPVWGAASAPYQPAEKSQILSLLQNAFAKRDRLFQTINS